MASLVSRILDFVGLEERDDDDTTPQNEGRGYDSPPRGGNRAQYDDYDDYDQRGRNDRSRNDDGYGAQRQPRQSGFDRGHDNRGYEGRNNDRDRYDDRQSLYERRSRFEEQEPERARKGGKVVNHPRAVMETPHQHSMTIYQMRDYDDARAVIDDLLADKTVLINLEMVDVEVSQRIVDMLSGASYAMGATLKKSAAYSYLLAPQTVDVSGSYEPEGNTKQRGSFFNNRR